MEVTLGGDRLGSGNKNKIELHNYYRSTHNLSQRFTSTMGVGMCVPCLVIPALRGDVFDININGACRTIPTNAPLFSTFKMQVDIFECAVRLYQAILHNNPLFIGLKMKDVKFPLLAINAKRGENGLVNGKCADTSLMKYLGLSGIGRVQGAGEQTEMYRHINAIPALAYYDICKTYYSNKQEDNAYICSSQKTILEYNKFSEIKDDDDNEISFTQLPGDPVDRGAMSLYSGISGINGMSEQFSTEFSPFKITFFQTTTINEDKIYVRTFNNDGTTRYTGSLRMLSELNELAYTKTTSPYKSINIGFPNASVKGAQLFWTYEPSVESEQIKLTSFPLKNIDDMRMNILSAHTLGTPYVINYEYTDLPYGALVGMNSNGSTKNANELQGLFLKTYQADLFNAWVNTDWIDGENGIAEMTKIAVSDGAVYMDAMLLAEKTYNMLNRIAVAGGTYEDWQNVVYTESSRKHIESPIYCGGLSNEIVFEEIVQTTPTDGAPLGTLGGRGIAVKRKGGNVSIKCDEASYIIGIVSITPRIYYTQGNEFYLTEIKSMDDMHKPALDGIGFQDLIAERLLWSTTNLLPAGQIATRPRVGKVPAWIEYMTAVDKAYGEFCDVKKQGSMILGRHYEMDTRAGHYGEIMDATTYIDPAKYNYVFGKNDLLAQNFWVQIDFDIKARRLMSAKQIPNL